MSERRCSKCKLTLPIEKFGKHSQRKDGISLWCKDCNRQSIARLRATPEGAEKHREREKARYHSDPKPMRKRLDEWRAANLERARETNNVARLRRMEDPEYRKKENERIAKWGKENKVRRSASARANLLRRRHAMPSWLNAIQKAQIQEFYEISAARTMQTGIKHHVDHIFSIHGQGWTGLHVPWNLQVLTAADNDKKWIKVPKKFEHMLWNPQKNLRSHL
jgi:5-methylcytosine-specific restriction endonuclease McrA